MSGYTQAQLDSLRAAVATGVRTIKVDGKEVTYSSTGEMLRLIAVIEGALTPAASRVTYYNPRYDRGL